MKWTWLKVICIAVIVLPLLIFGCAQQAEDGRDIWEVRREKVALSHMPPGATDIKNLGNDWFTFTLDDKKFLAHFWYGSHSEEALVVTQIK